MIGRQTVATPRTPRRYRVLPEFLLTNGHFSGLYGGYEQDTTCLSDSDLAVRDGLTSRSCRFTKTATQPRTVLFFLLTRPSKTAPSRPQFSSCQE